MPGPRGAQLLPQLRAAEAAGTVAEGTVAEYQQLQKRARYPANRPAFVTLSQAMMQQLGNAVSQGVAQGVAQGVSQAVAPMARDVADVKNNAQWLVDAAKGKAQLSDGDPLSEYNANRDAISKLQSRNRTLKADGLPGQKKGVTEASKEVIANVLRGVIAETGASIGRGQRDGARAT